MERGQVVLFDKLAHVAARGAQREQLPVEPGKTQRGKPGLKGLVGQFVLYVLEAVAPFVFCGRVHERRRVRPGGSAVRQSVRQCV